MLIYEYGKILLFDLIISGGINLNLSEIKLVFFDYIQRVWEQGFNLETLFVFLGAIGFVILFGISG